MRWRVSFNSSRSFATSRNRASMAARTFGVSSASGIPAIVVRSFGVCTVCIVVAGTGGPVCADGAGGRADASTILLLRQSPRISRQLEERRLTTREAECRASLCRGRPSRLSAVFLGRAFVRIARNNDADKPSGRYNHGQPVRLADHATGRNDPRRARDRLRGPDRLCPQNAEATGGLCRVGNWARPSGDHRRRGRCGAPPRDGRVHDYAAGIRRADPEPQSQRPRQSAVDRPDASRGPGGDARHRRGRGSERGVDRGWHYRASGRSRTGETDGVARAADGGGRRSACRTIMTRSAPIPPGSTIGILGSGQLGRMTALAAAALGYRCHIFSPDEASPAGQVAAAETVADYTDHDALASFAAAVDVVTFEFENIPHESVQLLERLRPVRPGWQALQVSQDRLVEKDFLRSLEVRTADYRAVAGPEELAAAAADLGGEGVLKTTRFGYDGKGQVRIRPGTDLNDAWREMGGRVGILEAFVDFEREISVIVARSADGSEAAYVPVENRHKDHILHMTLAPADI